MQHIKPVLALLIVTFLCLAVGCGSTAPAGKKRRLFFPAHPATPKLEYVDVFSSQYDFPRTTFQRVIDKLLGRDAPILFSRPFNIATRDGRKIYVSDIGRPGLFIYDLDKETLRVIEGDMLGFLPQGLDVDAEGNIYITSTKQNAVMVFDENERPLYSIRDKLDWPVGVASDSKRGRVYVANSHGHNVTVYDKKGKHVQTIGRRGHNEGEFNYPTDVDVGPEGEVVVADTMNGRIQVFDASGKFLRAFGQRGDGASNFTLLKGIGVDSEGHIYAADAGVVNIKIFDMDGNYLLTFGSSFPVNQDNKVAPGGFVLPSDVDVDENNRIYIVDQNNSLFQVFQYLDAAYLKKNPL